METADCKEAEKDGFIFDSSCGNILRLNGGEESDALWFSNLVGKAHTKRNR